VSIPTFLLDKWKTWKSRQHANSYHSVQIKQFVLGLFAYTDDLNKFKTHLRDFLISLKEFSDDNAELYAEEREQAVRDAQAAERTRALKVGGLLKPSEMDQEDEL
jgi:exportin-1